MNDKKGEMEIRVCVEKLAQSVDIDGGLDCSVILLQRRQKCSLSQS
jgi:hypothetical protein